MNAVSADKTPTPHPPSPSECKIYQSEVEELTDLMPTTISMQAADRKFFSQNDLSQPSVLAFCHICKQQEQHQQHQPLPRQGTGQMQTYSSQGDTVMCDMCHKATKSSKIRHHPKQAAKTDTYPFFISVFCCCGFCCCLGFCCCRCGGKGGGFFCVCVWSFFFFCLVYLANIYATKCWYQWVNLFTIKSNKEQNKNVSLT